MRRPRTLVVGGGGREHAIGAALVRSEAPLLVAAPHENPGLRALAQSYLISAVEDGAKIARWAVERGAELAVIGPEAAIAAGVADELRRAKVPTVGPSAAAGRIESSKAFARDLMQRRGVPGLPTFRTVSSAAEVDTAIGAFHGPFVVKASGLAAGKGVWVQGADFQTPAEGGALTKRLLPPEGREKSVVLEEKLEGEEFSLLALVDGTSVFPMPVVQDYKRAKEGNQGPNTGGMGSYSERDHLLPFLPRKDRDAAVGILRSVVGALREEGIEYRGVLYGGFMLTAKGPQVVEFNARFGDPEGMNLLTLFDGTDFADLMFQVATSRIDPAHVSFRLRATVCKYVVPIGYPENPRKGVPLQLDTQAIQDLGVTVYYGSVTPGPHPGEVLTGSSRAIALVGESSARKDAEARVELALKHVHGDFYVRHDIGTVPDVKSRVDHMSALVGAAAFDPTRNPTRSGPSPPPVFL
ncbi:MAG: phosphoribosylamine--glycine ligase [Euryarchaeota archaeon]|nr:phosphoribosylamine--glycine ligase [Euryarchaeota archaeon]